jgi:1-acyl-sn-glycerol-3-phosphate acyltransferase
MMAGNVFYRSVKTAFRVFFTLYNRLEVRGRENIPPGGAAIVASNHSSNIDPPLIGSVYPGTLRYLAKDSLFSVPLLGFLIRALGAIPVSRQDSQRAGVVMKLLLERLGEGETILVFPEGTRSRDGRLKPLEGGAAFLSVKAGTPVIPVFVRGSYKACPPGKMFPNPSKLVVSVSKPLFPDAGIESERERRLALTRSLEGALRALASEAEHHD